MKKYLNTSKIFIVFLLIVAQASLVSCVSTSTVISIAESNNIFDESYNVPSSGTLQFDGSKYIRVSNISCLRVAFELYQDTEKASNDAILMKAGVIGIENIGQGKSLLLKIDGEVYEFAAGSDLTKHEKAEYGEQLYQYSYKPYIVSERFIRKVAAADELLVRLHFLNGKFVDSKCTSLTIEEYNEFYSEYNVTQENLEASRQFEEYTLGINGFRKFVELMDSMKW